ncbi:MAG: alpha-glucan family phosphorylase [Spirochaetota bacterium]|nr:alpha-glucan family phosphorylase [Spirochaetota bacterium]
MKTIRTFKVKPAIPDRLKPLLKIANNLWWSWTPKAIDLFRGIDLDLWTKVSHNPIQLLGSIPQKRFKELEESESFCSNMDLVEVELDWHIFQPTWFTKIHKKEKDYQIAYFSAEFGLHECLPIYSGGLGILSGDHLKSADELGIPLVGFGLAYRQGYFHQFLNADGWQQEVYPENDFTNMPMTLECREDGLPVIVDVDLPGRKLYAQVWRIDVGKVPLYLLDANIDKNSDEDRQITAKLYGGDHKMRIKQEILLGIGGMRTLRTLGIKATVFHMNEGHSAFLAIERILELIEKDSLSFVEAAELVSANNIFTTHTAVPAGLDKFDYAIIDEYLASYYNKLGISRDKFLSLGQSVENDNLFSMAMLAISLSYTINGVSKLHGDVSRRMWSNVWPDIPLDEMPIQSITNGVHTRTWISDEITRLFERYLGPLWVEDPVNSEVWKRVDIIPDSELWRSQERLKERLVAFARYRLRKELKRIGAPQYEVNRASEVLDPDALTICFARRFATYKRANLILKDPNRLAKILNDKEKPVQLIFAGKAHPNDQEGKELIRTLNHLTRNENFRTKIVFIEDYDTNIARYMVQGADIWLNTPRRPLEASGTSGMKAAANGGLNLSILDGWWCEGYNMNNGWAIGGGEIYDNLKYQDEVESNALYDILEQEIIPLYYRRGADGLSRGWIAKMKESIKTLGPVFNTNRMVKEYAERFYFPANKTWEQLSINNYERAKSLVIWKKKIEESWDKITFENINFSENMTFEVGSEIEINAKINLNKLTPDDVSVELYYGKFDAKREVSDGNSIIMSCQECDLPKGQYFYTGKIICGESGQHGFSIRILPKHEDLVNKFNLRLIHWG